MGVGGYGSLFPSGRQLLLIVALLMLIGGGLALGVSACVRRFGYPTVGWVTR